MKNTGRKTVKGRATSAPMVAKVLAKTVGKMVGTVSPTTASSSARPSRDEIAMRSYEIFLEQGGMHGRDEEHWLQAERELTAAK